MKRATLIGEKTGGSTGNPLVFDIHAAKVAVVTKWDYFPDGTEFVGVGIHRILKSNLPSATLLTESIQY